MKPVSAPIASPVLISSFHDSTTQRSLFSKKGFLLLISGIVMIISSCQKDEMQTNSQNQDLLNGAQKQNVQKKSVPFDGKFAISPIENGVTGIGEGRHIGRFTLIARDNEENFPVITGTVTITAANQDQIFATHTGFAQEIGNGMLKVDFDNTIKGGTGRFAGAMGSFQMHAIVNEATGTGNATFDGTISY